MAASKSSIRMATMVGSAIALSAFVGVNYYGEKVARTAHARHAIDEVNSHGDQGKYEVVSKEEGAFVQKQASKIQSRQSGAYYGAMSGEYTVKQ